MKTTNPRALGCAARSTSKPATAVTASAAVPRVRIRSIRTPARANRAAATEPTMNPAEATANATAERPRGTPNSSIRTNGELLMNANCPPNVAATMIAVKTERGKRKYRPYAANAAAGSAGRGQARVNPAPPPKNHQPRADERGDDRRDTLHRGYVRLHRRRTLTVLE